MGFRSLKMTGQPGWTRVIAVVADLVGEIVDGPKRVEMRLATSPALSTATVPAASGS
jgi:hypothetical protein